MLTCLLLLATSFFSSTSKHAASNYTCFTDDLFQSYFRGNLENLVHVEQLWVAPTPTIRLTTNATNGIFVSLCLTLHALLGCRTRWVPSKFIIHATQLFPPFISNNTNWPLLTAIIVPLNRDHLDLEDLRVNWEKPDHLWVDIKLGLWRQTVHPQKLWCKQWGGQSHSTPSACSKWITARYTISKCLSRKWSKLGWVGAFLIGQSESSST